MFALATIALAPDPMGGERPYRTAADPVERPLVYARPAIAPFEPPSNFGRRRAQGDDEGDLHRRPLVGPVAVDAYRRSYEYSPSDNEIAYEQGVAQAQIDAQARRGRLDGVWRVTDTDGDTLSDLVVSDAGDGGAIDVAWNVGLSSDREASVTARHEGDAVVIEAGLGARTARLRLTRAPNGWTGALMRGGREQSVTLTRSDDS